MNRSPTIRTNKKIIISQIKILLENKEDTLDDSLFRMTIRNLETIRQIILQTP